MIKTWARRSAPLPALRLLEQNSAFNGCYALITLIFVAPFSYQKTLPTAATQTNLSISKLLGVIAPVCLSIVKVTPLPPDPKTTLLSVTETTFGAGDFDARNWPTSPHSPRQIIL